MRISVLMQREDFDGLDFTWCEWYLTRREAVAQMKAELQAESCTLAFWRSDQSGEACNGGSGTQAKIGDTQTIQGPLKICTSRGLHATMKPEVYQGSRLWIVALHGEVQWQEDKCAALKREIIGEVPIKL